MLGLYGLFGTLRYDVEGTDGESLWKRREILSRFGNPGEVGLGFRRAKSLSLDPTLLVLPGLATAKLHNFTFSIKNI